ncbi:hypothetical protein [Bradyrhizobium sp.]|uniref:hypothetical protein n=1 Tax=Bradyrhizobium sp. TaxID=376 RepID=UPI002DDD3996|nr:hypothetical protein [Bradyrhizobium sp.]HEV2159836.1 hypothetical protein [Bradyrhizobium sp.]
MRKLRRLRWRSRKIARIERRLFETVIVGLLRELTVEIEPGRLIDPAGAAAERVPDKPAN